MELTDVIMKRRSIRKYKPDPVDDGLLEQVLEAGRAAPTASNSQDWYAIVVRGAEIRTKLADACRNQEWVGGAPIVLVICGTGDRLMSCGQSTNTIDCSIALTQMILRAADLGLGTCWLGAFWADQVRAILDVPTADTIIAVTPIGYPDVAPESRGRKDLAEFVRYVD
jgi:nitroreductase